MSWAAVTRCNTTSHVCFEQGQYLSLLYPWSRARTKPGSTAAVHQWPYASVCCVRFMSVQPGRTSQEVRKVLSYGHILVNPPVFPEWLQFIIALSQRPPGPTFVLIYGYICSVFKPWHRACSVHLDNCTATPNDISLQACDPEESSIPTSEHGYCWLKANISWCCWLTIKALW